MVWALKYHYSIARAENLKWILAPTAALVETITGNLFYFETDTGYINHDLRILIAPACAGVNFLIAAFCMSFFCGIFKLTGLKSKCMWLIICSVGAYVFTVSVNALRIWLSIATIAADIHGGWFTPQRVHRMSGILIYFFFLSVFYHIIQKIIHPVQAGFSDKPKSNINRTIHIGILPLIFYWITAIAVPWLNSAYEKDPSGFAEHSLTVGFVSFAVFIIFFIIRSMMARMTVGSDNRLTHVGIIQKP
jgi:exosortase K